MKVARADSAHGPLVVKVFVLSDLSFQVEIYREQLLQISRRLQGHPNCAPFTRVYVSFKFGL